MVWRVGLPGLKGRIFREDIFRFAQHILIFEFLLGII